MDWSNFGIINGLYVVIIGFGMVFLILCIISFILSIFSFVYKINEKKKTKQSLKTTEAKPAVINQEETIIPKQQDNLEIIAVITAAIAASLNTTSDKIIVHSIRKTTNWNKAAISENHRNFY